MTDDPRDPRSVQTSIGNQNTFTNSTVNQSTHVGDIHQAHPWQPRWEPAAAEAQALLDLMPRTHVPEISTLPAGSRMPFAPNPHFIGRDGALLALATAFHGGTRVAIGPKAATTGLGGIGKTSVAVEVVHRYGAYFAGGVFWLSFADPAAIPNEIAVCGGPGLLDLHPAYGDLKQDEQIALVRQAWQRPIPRLVVFDNCEDPQLVQQWAPTSGGCRILITSRRQRWPSGFGIAAQRLDVLPRHASMVLLQQLAPRLTAGESDHLAIELGDFPLALQLAGSYLAAYPRTTVTTLLAELTSANMLAHPALRGLADDVLPTAHDQHVGRTFLVSYQRLDSRRDAFSLALLARAACLAPGEPIPIDLLLASVEMPTDDAHAQAALQRLVDLGFLTTEGETVLLHRLVHAFVGAVTLERSGLAAVESVLIQRAMAINTAGYPAAMTCLVPHLRWATQHWTSRPVPPRAAVCHELGSYLTTVGDHAGARPLLEQALTICEATLGARHPTTATSLRYLASLHEARGDYARARTFYERALAIREELLGPTHPDTATSLNDLAYLLRASGDDRSARQLYERALAIRESVLGPIHPDTATSLNNLAGLLRTNGDTGLARQLYERALAIREAILGPMHPDTATTLNNLAYILEGQSAYAAARVCAERALAIREEMLGPTHPDTATSLTNLAGLLRVSGDYAGARPLAERALAIHETVLGPTHPATAQSIHNLARLLWTCGDMLRAHPLCERALIIRETVLGASHPATAASLHLLALTLRAIGDHPAARLHAARALMICEQELGATHPTTQTVRETLDTLSEGSQSLPDVQL